MNRSELKNLTRRLRELPPIPIPPGLEDRLVAQLPTVRRPRRGRRVIFAIAGGLAAAACVAVALFVPRGDQRLSHNTVAVQPSVAKERQELRELQVEMRHQLDLTRRMETRERRAKADFAIERFRSSVALERELAATILVLQGDWRRTRGESGIAEYRRAVELFADTSAAAKAKMRLGKTSSSSSGKEIS